MNGPMISVIMPAYNAERYIGAAIASVQAQTVTDWELLVMDDCSTDSTCAIVERLAALDARIRLYRNETNLGAAGSRNRGLELCRGTFVAPLDSDDLWLPEKLEKQLALLEKTGADLAYSSYAIMDGAGEKAKEDYIVPETVDFEGLLRQNVIGCSTVVLRRQSLGETRFTTEYYHEDYALWLQLLRSGCRMVGCTEVLAKWRLTAGSRSANKGSAARSRWKIYRDYLQLPLGKSVGLFCAYALGGVKKYLK